MVGVARSGDKEPLIETGNHPLRREANLERLGTRALEIGIAGRQPAGRTFELSYSTWIARSLAFSTILIFLAILIEISYSQ